MNPAKYRIYKLRVKKNIKPIICPKFTNNLKFLTLELLGESVPLEDPVDGPFFWLTVLAVE